MTNHYDILTAIATIHSFTSRLPDEERVVMEAVLTGNDFPQFLKDSGCAGDYPVDLLPKSVCSLGMAVNTAKAQRRYGILSTDKDWMVISKTLIAIRDRHILASQLEGTQEYYSSVIPCSQALLSAYFRGPMDDFEWLRLIINLHPAMQNYELPKSHELMGRWVAEAYRANDPTIIAIKIGEVVDL